MTVPDRLKNIKIFLEGTKTCGRQRRSTARQKEVTPAVLMENFSYLTLTTFCVNDTLPFLLRSSCRVGVMYIVRYAYLSWIPFLHIRLYI